MLMVDYSLSDATAYVASKPKAVVSNTYIEQIDSTPIPLELADNIFFSKPTGSVVIFNPPDQLVADALKHVSAMAFIPINSEDELLVEKVFRDRVGNQLVRAIKRTK